MEIILALFTYLTTSLTPVEFLVVMAIIGVSAFFLVSFALKKRKAIMALLGKGEDENLKAINKQLEGVVTREDLDKLALILRHEFTIHRQSIDSFKEKFVEISTIRQDIIDKELERVILEIEENRKIFAAQHDHSTEQQQLILSTSNRLFDGQARILSQVEKVDEYLKAAIPEFRRHHDELDDGIKDLSRDLALIERSLTLSLNSSSGIKLR